MACVSCLALCLSCTAYKQPLDGERIAVEFHDDILKTSSFREGYELVALDAPCNEAVISSVDRLLFAEGRIVVLDQVGNKVLLFDSDGGFLKSTSKMVGKGHNEYIRISDAAIDESARKLYVHCDAPYQMMVFDWDLNLERVIPMDYYMREMVMEGDFVYGICWNGDKGYEFLAQKKDRLEEKPEVLASCADVVPGRLAMGKSLAVSGRVVYASLPFDDRIYKAGDGRIIGEFVLDFGDQGLMAHPVRQGLNPHWFDRQYRDVHWSIVNMGGSDSLLFFNTNRSTRFVLDQKNLRCDAYPEIIDDMLPFSCSSATPAQGMENSVVYEVSPSVVAGILQSAEGKGEALDSAFVRMAGKVRADGNPVFVVWRLPEAGG